MKMNSVILVDVHELWLRVFLFVDSGLSKLFKSVKKTCLPCHDLIIVEFNQMLTRTPNPQNHLKAIVFSFFVFAETKEANGELREVAVES